MTDAEKLFNQIVVRCFDRWSFILSFRVTSNQGMEAAKKKIETEKVTFVNDLLQGPDYEKLFLDKKGFFEAMPPEKLVQTMTDETVRQAQSAVDAASIVFAHSVLDGAALDYCRVTALIAPRDWETVIDQRQIKLSDARESGYEQILKNKLDEFLEQLDRESLLKKADHLLARCKPPEKWSPMRDYVYDRDRLEKLDDYRHNVIHGDSLGKGIAKAEGEVDYLMKTVLFFQGLVNLRYGLMLDPYYAFTGKELPAQTAAASPAAAGRAFPAKAANEVEKKEPSR